VEHKSVLDLELLSSGRCEPLKAAVHGVLLVTMGVCAAYNTAAFLKRRQPHLAINAVIYGAMSCTISTPARPPWRRSNPRQI
jgi:hypothetical protein